MSWTTDITVAVQELFVKTMPGCFFLDAEDMLYVDCCVANCGSCPHSKPESSPRSFDSAYEMLDDAYQSLWDAYDHGTEAEHDANFIKLAYIISTFYMDGIEQYKLFNDPLVEHVNSYVLMREPVGYEETIKEFLLGLCRNDEEREQVKATEWKLYEPTPEEFHELVEEYRRENGLI